MLKDYIWYVCERHRIWERRAAGEPGPWTDDPVLAGWKFCNDFRILDAGTQFLVGRLYGDEAPWEDQVMRAFLYRYNNRPEPWEFFELMEGRMPLIEDLETGLLQDRWTEYRDSGGAIVGNAYMMFVGAENKRMRRCEWILGLTAQAFCPTGGSPRHYQGGFGWSQGGVHYILPELRERWGDAEKVFRTLTRLPRCSSFMGQQILTDYTYMDGSNMTDSDHVVPGPGAVQGLKLVYPHLKAGEALQEAVDFWGVSADTPFLVLPGGDRHYLSAMDIQNTFCEFQKYVRRREGGKSRTYKPSHPRETWAHPVLPASW